MTLNLPDYGASVRRNDSGQPVIYDVLRKRFVALTPEEWVRQHFVHFLIDSRGFPAGLMANEVSLVQNGIPRRCDTLVADHQGRPLCVIEYKAPSVNVTQATFDQIVRYNMVLRARFLMVSNGLNHYCCRIDYHDNSYQFLRDVPDYSLLSTDE